VGFVVVFVEVEIQVSHSISVTVIEGVSDVSVEE
jgi:hypothetical protein